MAVHYLQVLCQYEYHGGAMVAEMYVGFQWYGPLWETDCGMGWAFGLIQQVFKNEIAYLKWLLLN